MVLEVLVSPKKVTGKPWEMFFIGVVYSLVSFALSYWVFRGHVGVVMITFTAIASIPFIYTATLSEEKKEKVYRKYPFKEHSQLLGMFTFLFLGFVAAFCVLYLVLPEEIALEVFKDQVSAITDVNAAVGHFSSLLTDFNLVLFHNIGVLLFCLVFSFFYGVGAIFILSWNASVMSVAIGDSIKTELLHSGVFTAVPFSLVRYFLHGIPEIIAYFAASLAGGIISVALMKRGIKSKHFLKASKDALHILAFSVLLLFLAALIEIFISLKMDRL
jgi:uncharacterized membrane protein SpoIIM required for sporulation